MQTRYIDLFQTPDLDVIESMEIYTLDGYVTWDLMPRGNHDRTVPIKETDYMLIISAYVILVDQPYNWHISSLMYILKQSLVLPEIIPHDTTCIHLRTSNLNRENLIKTDYTDKDILKINQKRNECDISSRKFLSQNIFDTVYLMVDNPVKPTIHAKIVNGINICDPNDRSISCTSKVLQEILTSMSCTKLYLSSWSALSEILGLINLHHDLVFVC